MSRIGGAFAEYIFRLVLEKQKSEEASSLILDAILVVH
jgi:hypothetical protein